MREAGIEKATSTTCSDRFRARARLAAGASPIAAATRRISRTTTTTRIGIDPFVVPARSTTTSSSWMHEMWDETKHLTHEVEKFALKRVGTSGKPKSLFHSAEAARRDGVAARRRRVDDGIVDVGSSASRFADTDIRSEPVHKSASSLYAVSGADPENDDLDFANELRMRPREVDDEAEDAEIEAAEDAQQKLFDAEAIETTKPAKKGWW